MSIRNAHAGYFQEVMSIASAHSKSNPIWSLCLILWIFLALGGCSTDKPAASPLVGGNVSETDVFMLSFHAKPDLAEEFDGQSYFLGIANRCAQPLPSPYLLTVT